MPLEQSQDEADVGVDSNNAVYAPHHHVKWNDGDGDGDEQKDGHNANENDSHSHHEDTKKTLGTEDGSSHHSPSSPSTSNNSGRNGGNHSGSGGGGQHVVGPLCSCLKGMRRDLQARIPLYLDDWKRPTSFVKVLNATIFAFVVQLIPALIFAELLDMNTHGSLGVAETLLSAGIIGIIYALLSGQPLVLVGITG